VISSLPFWHRALGNMEDLFAPAALYCSIPISAAGSVSFLPAGVAFLIFLKSRTCS